MRQRPSPHLKREQTAVSNPFLNERHPGPPSTGEILHRFEWLWHCLKDRSAADVLPPTDNFQTLPVSNPFLQALYPMNVNPPRRGNTKVNTRQMILFGVMALAAIYHFGRPTLERWTGRSLPAIMDDDRSGSREQAHDYDISFPGGSPSQSVGDGQSSGGNSVSPGKAARAWLKSIGRGEFESPAGLVYGSGREHRVDHVLLHCKDDPSKPTHGIFVGDAVTVLKMVDEAYEKVKSAAPGVDSKKSGDKTTHTVSMGRVVGHTGGRKAQRGQKELRRVKLVLARNRVITAFPTN